MRLLLCYNHYHLLALLLLVFVNLVHADSSQVGRSCSTIDWTHWEDNRDAAAKALSSLISSEKATGDPSITRSPNTYSWEDPPSTVTTPTASTNANLDCTLINQDPDEGITEAYCSCSDSTTLPVLDVTATTGGPEQSCAYTALPASTTSVEPKETLLPATTSNCRVCEPATNNEDECTMLPNCTPSPTPSTVVHASKNGIHVGDLPQHDWYGQAYRDLIKKCPDTSQEESTCSTDEVSVNQIQFIEGDSDETSSGEVKFSIGDSHYSNNGQRNALIGAVLTAVNASATGKSCKNHDIHTSCREGPYDANDCQTTQASFCDASKYASASIIEDSSEIAFIEIEVKFHIDGLNEFLCNLIQDAMVAALDVVAPEVAIADWELLGGIELECAEMAGSEDG